jgi:hypothetical protein
MIAIIALASFASSAPTYSAYGPMIVPTAAPNRTEALAPTASTYVSKASETVAPVSKPETPNVATAVAPVAPVSKPETPKVATAVAAAVATPKTTPVAVGPIQKIYPSSTQVAPAPKINVNPKEPPEAIAPVSISPTVAPNSYTKPMSETSPKLEDVYPISEVHNAPEHVDSVPVLV